MYNCVYTYVDMCVCIYEGVEEEMGDKRTGLRLWKDKVYNENGPLQIFSIERKSA